MTANDELNRAIGEQIKIARKRQNLTLAKLADGLGLTYQQVAKYETGRNRVSASTLYRVAAIMDVELSFFFDGCTPIQQENRGSPSLNDQSDIELWAALSRVKDRDVRASLSSLLDALESLPGFHPKG